MKHVEIGPQPALLLAFRDEEQIGYMQTYSFPNGPRQDTNAAILASLPDVFSVRLPAQPCVIERRSADELRLRPDVEARVLSLLAACGLSGEEQTAAIDRFGWKVTEIPLDTTSIFDIGCGDGIELAFLHAAAPNARIKAVDLKYELRAEIGKLPAIRFEPAHIVEYLEGETETFDLIFSNHVVEHLYDPDRICALLRRRLNPGGTMLAALPLDGVVSAFWAGANDEKWRSSLAVAELDLGHPWKTTPSDLRETLHAAGFGDVRFIQRQGRLNAAIAGEERELAALEVRGRALHRLVFGPLRWGAAVLFGDRPPDWVVKLICALERRVWFGGNNVKNSVAPEVLVEAANPISAAEPMPTA
jgi:SAM-dependent methyltransferase